MISRLTPSIRQAIVESPAIFAVFAANLVGFLFFALICEAQFLFYVQIFHERSAADLGFSIGFPFSFWAESGQGVIAFYSHALFADLVICQIFGTIVGVTLVRFVNLVVGRT